MNKLRYVLAYIPIVGCIYLLLESFGKFKPYVLLKIRHYHITYFYHGVIIALGILKLIEFILN